MDQIAQWLTVFFLFVISAFLVGILIRLSDIATQLAQQYYRTNQLLEVLIEKAADIERRVSSLGRRADR